MRTNRRPTESISLLARLTPDATAAGTVSTAWLSTLDHETFAAIVAVGTLATSATVDAKLEQATDDSGTGAKDITGKAITQLAQADGDADAQAFINLRPDDLDFGDGFDHFRLSVTVGTDAADLTAIVLGLGPRREAAETFNAATVTEIV